MPSPLAAYLYFKTAEMPPEDVTDEWFLSPEPAPLTSEKVGIFTEQVNGLISDIEALDDPSDEEAVQFIFYERAKAAFGEEKSSIREFFKMLYLVVLEKPDGPRWGQFVALTGRDEFLSRLRKRMEAPFWSPTQPDSDAAPSP